MIDNKIADRITKSARNKEQKEDDRIMEETQELIILPKKREQIIKDIKKWNTIKLITCYFLKIMKVNNYLNLSLDNMYNENKSIRFKTPMLRSNLCDYSDAYILVKGTITVNGVANGAENKIIRRNRPLMLKNNAPFVSCMTKINNEFIEDADDLDIVMPLYNLLEYSKNYRKTIRSLYNYYRDELCDDNNPDNFPNTNVVNSVTFKYKNKIIGNTYNVTAGNDRLGTKKIELVIPLKYLGNFWRALNIPLISCKVFLELTWNKNCVITSLEQRQVDAGPPVVHGTTTGATLAINNCK